MLDIINRRVFISFCLICEETTGVSTSIVRFKGSQKPQTDLRIQDILYIITVAVHTELTVPTVLLYENDTIQHSTVLYCTV